MKRALLCTGLALTVIALVAMPAQAGQGNNTPSGPSYNLQVIAFDHCPGGTFTGSSRHEIAVLGDFGSGVCSNDEHQGCDNNGECTGGVCRDIATCASDGSACEVDSDCPAYDVNDLSADWCAAGPLPTGDPNSLVKTNKIFLTPAPEGESFQVLDGNACDSSGAAFQLPTDVYTQYSVYIRLVGKPGSKIGVTLCATELGQCISNVCVGGANDGAACVNNNDCSDELVCSTDNVIRVRTKGKSSFTNVTDELLTMTLCTDSPCTKANLATVTIFDPGYEDFFWNWNTQGRPHAQLKFYPNS